jgi:hypothetical protein
MRFLSSSVVAMALIAGATAAQAGALVPNKTLDINFVGFCDGMRLVINQTTGLVTGNSTGCLSDALVGTVGGNAKLGAGITVFANGVLYVIDDVPRTFTNYTADAVLINSGTYALGVPVRARGGRASSR